MEKNNIGGLMEDPYDDGLKAIMCQQFQDYTEEPVKKKESQPRLHPQAPAASVAAAAEPEGSYPGIPVYAPHWYDGLRQCAKYALGAGCLVVLFWYWNLTGQMAASAATPCMVACATMGGYKIGSVCRRGGR